MIVGGKDKLSVKHYSNIQKISFSGFFLEREIIANASLLICQLSFYIIVRLSYSAPPLYVGKSRVCAKITFFCNARSFLL